MILSKALSEFSSGLVRVRADLSGSPGFKETKEMDNLFVKITDFLSLFWLMVWNMNFIFPNSWDDDPI
jgi:hypothetical protein